MKLVKLMDMNMDEAYVNPEHILYIHDVSTFSLTKSAIVFDKDVVYVPYHASKVYEMIAEATEKNYISYERMMELIDHERRCKKNCTEYRRADD